MSMQDIIMTVQDFLQRWLTDAGFRDQYDGDLEAAMDDHGFEDVGPAELLDCLPLVAEELPLAHQRSVYDYMNTVNHVDTGSTFNVQQGGSHTTGVAEGTAAVAASAQADPYPGEEPMDAVVRHVYNIQNVYENNYSHIEDNDVVTTITAEGDVDFDQNVASGDGAFAGDDADGVVMGDNSGINADNVANSQVNNVEGDDNVVGNTIGDDANVVTGEFEGNLVDGDGNATAFGEGDATVDNSYTATDSFNTDNSTNDSYNDNDGVDDKDLIDYDDNDVVDDKDLVDYDDNDTANVEYTDDRDLIDYDDQDGVDIDQTGIDIDPDVIDVG